MADNLAWRIARAIIEIPTGGRTLGRFQKELKRQHIDLIPRFKDGQGYPAGLVFGIKGMGISGSAISSELTPKKMQAAGFRVSDTEQELEALHRAHVGFNEYAVGAPKPGKNGQPGTIGISKHYKERRDAVIRQSLTGGLKLDPDSVWIMKMLDFGSNWKNPVHHAEDHTKVYKDQGDGTYRRYNFGSKYLGVVERRSITADTDVLTIAADLEMGFAINGDPAVNPSVDYAPRSLRRTKRFTGFEPPKKPSPPKPNDLAGLPQELRERIEKGDLDVEVLTSRPPGIASARRSWLHFDIDEVALPEGFDLVFRPTEAAEHIVRTMLPPEFHGARFGAQLSSSAGMSIDKNDKDDAGGVRATRDSHSRSASMHLFVEVEKPVFPEDVKAWLETWETKTGRKGSLDLQIFEPNQVNYLMPPVFDTVDPYAERRHSVLQGNRKVRLPDHVDGMAIRGETERFYSPFRHEVIEREEAPLYPAHPRPKRQRGSGSRNWKIAAGPLPSGGAECRDYLARSVQSMAYCAIEENPQATVTEINSIRRRIADRATELWAVLYDQKRMSQQTYDNNSDEARYRLIDGALDKAVAKHGILSYAATNGLPDSAVKTEAEGTYLEALAQLN
ncbi:MAG: hypothetical protein ACFE0S_00390 [Rhodospirillales bacterium]